MAPKWSVSAEPGTDRSRKLSDGDVAGAKVSTLQDSFDPQLEITLEGGITSAFTGASDMVAAGTDEWQADGSARL